MLKMADNEAEKLAQAIKLTQKLRASVTKVFTNLSDGFQSSRGNEKALLAQLQKSLLAVNDNFSDLEKMSPSIQSLHSINSSGLLNLDPSTDKTPLGSQLHHSHKWTNKVHKFADYAQQILHLSSLKRSNQTGPTLSTKRPRKPTPVVHSYPPSNIDHLASQLDRMWPDMSITVARPMGNSTVLQITLAKTLRAVFVLRGLLIEYVSIKAYSEDFYTEEGKLDVWSKSRYQVFNKVTDLVTAATIHFYHPQLSDLSLRSFLVWFNNYKTLFSAPCSKCGKHLQGCVPPVWRDTRTSQPLHDGCRQ